MALPAPELSAQLPDNVVRLPQRRTFADYLSSPKGQATDPHNPHNQGVLKLVETPEESKPVPRSHPSTPHIENLVTFISIASLEAMAGVRSMAQLQRFVSAPVFDKMKRRAALLSHTSSPMGSRVHALKAPVQRRPSRIAHILSVRVCHISDTVFEAVAVVKDLQRVRPLAMRVELHRNNWRVTHFEVG